MEKDYIGVKVNTLRAAGFSETYLVDYLIRQYNEAMVMMEHLLLANSPTLEDLQKEFEKTNL
jgi:hypothetical protein